MHTTLNLSLASTLLALALTSVPAHGQQTATDGSPIATSVPDSTATKVFVLGTPHLSGVANRFEPSMVDSLIEALDAFGPDAIAVENLSGRQVAAMERWGGRLDTVTTVFAGDFLYHGHRVQDRSGWSWTEANKRADSLLASARSGPVLDPHARLSLVRSLTAAYRFPSAVLQWSYVPADVRNAQTVLPDTTAAALEENLTAANETYSIGMRLAQRRGDQRLHPVDHHGSKDLLVDIWRPLQQAIGDSMRATVRNHPALQREDSLMQVGLDQGSLLSMYRYTNSATKARASVDVQWRTLLRRPLPDGIGRTRLALWETRNLSMVAHIRRVTAQHPGGSILVIVGSSHKPFFDAYLDQMMGIQVVEAQEVLSSTELRFSPQ